jgi:hypothetical protein
MKWHGDTSARRWPVPISTQSPKTASRLRYPTPTSRRNRAGSRASRRPACATRPMQTMRLPAESFSLAARIWHCCRPRRAQATPTGLRSPASATTMTWTTSAVIHWRLASPATRPSRHDSAASMSTSSTSVLGQGSRLERTCCPARPSSPMSSAATPGSVEHPISARPAPAFRQAFRSGRVSRLDPNSSGATSISTTNKTWRCSRPSIRETGSPRGLRCLLPSRNSSASIPRAPTGAAIRNSIFSPSISGLERRPCPIRSHRRSAEPLETGTCPRSSG